MYMICLLGDMVFNIVVSNCCFFGIGFVVYEEC